MVHEETTLVAGLGIQLGHRGIAPTVVNKMDKTTEHEIESGVYTVR